MPEYRHTQMGWMIIGAVATVILLLAVLGFQAAGLTAGTTAVIVIMACALLLFGSLTVTVDGEYVRLRFGIGLVRQRFACRDIAEFRCVRNAWYNGWGIHMTAGGILYNVSGLSAVELRLSGGMRVRIGTDEPQALQAALERFIGERPRPADGQAAASAPRAARVGVFAAVAAATLIAVIGVMFALMLQPPTVTVSAEQLAVRSGTYRATIPMADITSASLERTLPRIRTRTNGFALGGCLRGHFRLDELGDGQLFIEAGAPPYVVVRTQRDFVIVNFKDPARTRAFVDDVNSFLLQR